MIRRATLSDVSTIHQIERKCFRRRSFSKAHIIWLLKNPASATYLYLDRERAVAAIMLKRQGEVARVVSIGVIPGYRRKGIGTELMAMAEEVMMEEGVRVMKLEVSVKNEGAIAFYRRLGYELDGVLKGYYSWGEDAYVMRKALGPGRNV
ncbi:MAG: GNAT family N-acetyltransferase [Thermoplasmata archaeon]